MTDLSQLQAAILAEIAAARDEAALEAVRVAALGKKGSVSALLSGLGKMTPDERKTQGAAINALKDSVNEALAARRAVLKEAALEARLKTETVDVTLPARAAGRRAGTHPSGDASHGRTRRHLRRHGIFDRRRAGHRDRRL